jgi:anti-sigma B factor antagonist
MEYSCINSDGAVIVRLHGTDLNAENSMRLRHALADMIRNGERRIVMDLKRLTFINSSGIAILLSILKSIGPSGYFVLVGLCHKVERAFEITRMDRILTIMRDERSALDHINGVDQRLAA